MGGKEKAAITSASPQDTPLPRYAFAVSLIVSAERMALLSEVLAASKTCGDKNHRSDGFAWISLHSANMLP